MKKYTALVFLTAFGYCTGQTLPSILRTPAQTDWFDNSQDFVLDPSTELGNGSPASTISVARLRHKPPGKAMALFYRGLKFVNARAWLKSVEEFKKAPQSTQIFRRPTATLEPLIAHCDGSMTQAQNSAARFNSILGLLTTIQIWLPCSLCRNNRNRLK